MKKALLLLTLALLGAAFFTPAIASDHHDTIRLTDRPHLERGMSRDTVREMFGAPSAQLSADVWVYFDFKAVNAVAARVSQRAAPAQQDTLVVGFKAGRVSLIRLCDGQPVRAFIARQAQRATPAVVAAR